jgi:hypothetical protein
MADPSLSPIVVGGLFSVAAGAVVAAISLWRSRRESSAALAKTVSEAAELSVSALCQVVDELRKENTRLRRPSRSDEGGARSPQD